MWVIAYLYLSVYRSPVEIAYTGACTASSSSIIIMNTINDIFNDDNVNAGVLVAMGFTNAILR